MAYNGQEVARSFLMTPRGQELRERLAKCDEDDEAQQAELLRKFGGGVVTELAIVVDQIEKQVKEIDDDLQDVCICGCVHCVYVVVVFSSC